MNSLQESKELGKEPSGQFVECGLLRARSEVMPTSSCSSRSAGATPDCSPPESTMYCGRVRQMGFVENAFAGRELDTEDSSLRTPRGLASIPKASRPPPSRQI